MSKINCGAKTCIYNINGGCNSGAIKINEIYQGSIKNIYCTSYISIHKNVQCNIKSKCEHVICNAFDCIHNNNSECDCFNIFISGNVDTNFKETRCSSFVSK